MSKAVAVSPMRLSVAVLSAAALWVVAMMAMSVALVAPMAGFDSGEPHKGDLLGALAFGLAVALFFGSGPVAFAIGRKKWLLALPLMGLVVWALGIAVAGLT